MPFDDEPVHAASNEEPSATEPAKKRSPLWARLLFWFGLGVLASLLLNTGGFLSLIPFLFALSVATWLCVRWFKADNEHFLIAQEVDAETPVRQLDGGTTLTLDEEIAFTALVSSIEDDRKDKTKFDVIVYKDLLKMPWSKKQ